MSVSLRESMLLAVILAAASLATAWDEPELSDSSLKPTPTVKKDVKKEIADLPAFTPAREAAALTFVQLHHKDLKRLLEGLQKKDPKAYESAIRELFTESERFSDLQIQDPEMYALALEQWKTKSRIDLLAARLRLASKPNVYEEKNLRGLVRKQIDLELAMARLEVRRVEKKLEKRKNEIYEKETSLEQILVSRFDKLLKRPSVATPSKPPAKPTSNINWSKVRNFLVRVGDKIEAERALSEKQEIPADKEKPKPEAAKSESATKPKGPAIN